MYLGFDDFEVHQHIRKVSPLAQVVKESDPRYRNMRDAYSLKPVHLLLDRGIIYNKGSHATRHKLFSDGLRNLSYR